MLSEHPKCRSQNPQSNQKYETQTTQTVHSFRNIPGRQYDLQSTTNLANGFQTVTMIAATNSFIQWTITTTESAGFYRVQLDP